MPCNCVLDKPTYPQNEEWGPLIWYILHTFAEKAGRQNNAITLGDEQRAWPLFISSLVQVIPCPYCKDHFQQYLKEHPFQLPADYTLWREYIPDYLYTFHETVNIRLKKPSFPKSDLSVTYKDTGRLKDVMNSLDKIMERAIKMGGVSLFYWRAWLKQYNLLKAAIL